MKSVTRTPCWLVPATITADALEDVKPQTSERCAVGNMAFDSATPSSANTIAPTSGEQLIAASGSASNSVPWGTRMSMCSSIPEEIGKSWNGNWYRLTAQCPRITLVNALYEPSCSGEVPLKSMVSESPSTVTATEMRSSPSSCPVVSMNT